MSVNPTVLKLGGSVITKKEKPMTPNLWAIRRLAKEIKEANVKPLIIVHGGGGFGHWWAAKYRIKEGYKDPSQIMGFSKTHQAMVALNTFVVDALIQHNIPAVGIQPSSCIITKSGRIHIMEESPFTKLLEMGFVSVLYGDAILDSDAGFSILSGDQLVTELALRFDADRVVMGVDVDGLYTADPKVDASAQLINRITPHELESLKERMGEIEVTDVTGGMLGKIRELIPAVKQGILVLIVNAIKPNNIEKALKGEKVVGTIIERSETIA